MHETKPLKPTPIEPPPAMQAMDLSASAAGSRVEKTGRGEKRIAIIGGGWAGCAAAVELVDAGHCVALFESARTLGGRARAVEINGKLLDNGQHILLGAYGQTLQLMRRIGIRADDAFLRLPLQMRYPSPTGMDFVAPRLPAPWHVAIALFRAKGLKRADKLALARFSSAARWMGWRMNDDCSVTELLERFDQTDTLIRLMWRPLCIAALNTPPERASAQTFLNVLRDSLGARRAASDMLLPRVDLSALFPQRAAKFVAQRGGVVRTGCAVRGLRKAAAGWELDADGVQIFDAVVLATSAAQAGTLLENVCVAHAPGGGDVPQQLHALDYEPITTCYLQYRADVRLAQAFFALEDDPTSGHWGQFVFDRGQLDTANPGLLAVVVSASSDAIELGHAALAEALANQLAQVLQDPALAQPEWSKVISEKRATFSCTPALKRPANDIGLDGLVLAGDYTAGEYPATLESAIRSGLQAARLLMR